jgi:hypothetical protein
MLVRIRGAPAHYDVPILLIIFCIIGTVFSTVAIILVTTRGGGGPPHHEREHDKLDRLFFYDQTDQAPGGVNLWTTIHYNKQFTVNGGEHFILVNESNLYCIRSGVYIMHLTVQSALLPGHQHHEASAAAAAAEPHGHFHCRACNTWLELRGVRQAGGSGPWLEVPASLAFISPATGSRLLSKEFLVAALAGDVFRMQFKTACPRLHLVNHTRKTGPGGDEILASSTLLIH